MVLMDCLAFATTLGFAWNAMPSPAVDNMGKSLAPSPTAIVCAISTFSTCAISFNNSALRFYYVSQIAAGQFTVYYFQFIGINIINAVFLFQVVAEIGESTRKYSYFIAISF